MRSDVVGAEADHRLLRPRHPARKQQQRSRPAFTWADGKTSLPDARRSAKKPEDHVRAWPRSTRGSRPSRLWQAARLASCSRSLRPLAEGSGWPLLSLFCHLPPWRWPSCFFWRRAPAIARHFAGAEPEKASGAWAAALAFAIVGLAVFLYALPTVITSASGFCK